MPKYSQNGYSLPLILFAVVVLLAGGAYVIKSQSEIKTETAVTTEASPSPSMTASPSASAKASVTTTTQVKKSPSPSPSVSPSPTPSPSSSPSPSVKPSPQPGVYRIKQGPDVSTDYPFRLEGGGSIGATLVDSNNDVIVDQSDFEYVWTIQDPSIATITPQRPDYVCNYVHYLKPVCPEMYVDLKPKMRGQTSVSVKVIKKSENKQVADYSYRVSVN